MVWGKPVAPKQEVPLRFGNRAVAGGLRPSRSSGCLILRRLSSRCFILLLMMHFQLNLSAACSR